MVYDTEERDNYDRTIPTQDKIYTHLNIPLFLISKRDGELIKNQIEKSNDVLLSVDIDFPQ